MPRNDKVLKYKDYIGHGFAAAICHGFHEDGIESGLWVAEQLGCGQNWHHEAPYPRLPQQYLTEHQQAA